MSLQEARHNSGILKFSNYKIGLLPNCPCTKPGSNNCGFFITSYISLYDFNDGDVAEFVDPMRTKNHTLFFDILIIHNITMTCAG